MIKFYNKVQSLIVFLLITLSVYGQHKHEELPDHYSNSILVMPDRSVEYDQNYILFSEELVHTVQFRNTTPDIVQTIIVRDSLDPNLDWDSFRIVEASHAYEAWIYEGGVIEFIFRDVNLPNTSTNETESQGFISYALLPKQDLQDHSEIYSNAQIFLNQDERISTNSILNIVVSELPQVTSIQENFNPEFFRIYPNPFQHTINIHLEEIQPDLMVHLFDYTGRVIYTSILDTRNQIVDTEDLQAGFYSYQVMNRKGETIITGKLIKQ